MSTSTVSQIVSPMKGDIVLTHKGHRRLWDGRHWRVLCRISNCKAQRQGSLYNKFGLCKKHFTEMELNLFKSLTSSLAKIEKKEQKQEEETIYKRRNLNIIVEQLRRSQAMSESCSIE
jgi:hypothetical protein